MRPSPVWVVDMEAKITDDKNMVSESHFRAPNLWRSIFEGTSHKIYKSALGFCAWFPALYSCRYESKRKCWCCPVELVFRNVYLHQARDLWISYSQNFCWIIKKAVFGYLKVYTKCNAVQIKKQVYQHHHWHQDKVLFPYKLSDFLRRWLNNTCQFILDIQNLTILMDNVARISGCFFSNRFFHSKVLKEEWEKRSGSRFFFWCMIFSRHMTSPFRSKSIDG